MLHIYTDGSCALLKGVSAEGPWQNISFELMKKAHADGSKIIFVQSWGVKIIGEDLDVEISGAKEFKYSEIHTHEMVAFVEAVIFCWAHGYSPKDVTFHTDDQVVSYAGKNPIDPELWEASSNKWKFANHAVAQLAALSRFYPPQVIDIVKDYLLESRINKIKGHGTCIYNRRVDFLAQVGRIQKFPMVSSKKYRSVLKQADFLSWMNTLLGNSSPAFNVSGGALLGLFTKGVQPVDIVI